MDKLTSEISAYVKNKGITIKAIARNTGIPYNVLQPCFSGKRALRADELLSVCDFLNILPQDFWRVKKHTQSDKKGA